MYLYCKTKKKDTAMLITEGKITEIFFMADEFCKSFDAMIERYAIKNPVRRRYYRDGMMTTAVVMTIMIIFHASFFDNFIVNILSALSAYCSLLKKPCLLLLATCLHFSEIRRTLVNYPFDLEGLKPSMVK